MINTPHLSAEKDDIANIVIMPGDPKRSKFIVDNYLDNAKLVTDIRGIQCYTGYYNKKKITVMASGMGNASMGIYSYELYKYFDVDSIIRVGTSGALHNDINLKDIVVCNEILTNTNYNQLNINSIHSIKASNKLINNIKDLLDNKDINYLIGKVYNTDTFYEDKDQDYFEKQDALCVEMETAGLYENAKNFNKNAIAIYTITDHLKKNEHVSSEDREINVKQMIEIALELAERID